MQPMRLGATPAASAPAAHCEVPFVDSRQARLTRIQSPSVDALTECRTSGRQPALGSRTPHCHSVPESSRQIFSISSSSMRRTSSGLSVAAMIAATRGGRAIS